MDEKKRRELVLCGALVWALIPIGLVMVAAYLGHMTWFCLLAPQLFLLVSVKNEKRIAVLISMAAVPLVTTFFFSSGIYSPDFLFCLWLANAGTLFCLRGESAKVGREDAVGSYNTALVFISLFVFGEIVLGQVNESHHRLSDIGYYAYLGRFIGLFVFGLGTWAYCIRGAFQYSVATSEESAKPSEEPPSL